jgi:DNA-binding SARP family transcriptional activator/predicted ATPase
LGQFRVAANGVPVTALVTHRMQALLAYLLLHAGSPVPRQQLAFLFWPDTTEPQARTNLRQLLHHLRSAWQDFDGYIEMDTQVLCWRTERAFTLDVAEFDAAAAQADQPEMRDDYAVARVTLEKCAALYRGDLLPVLDDEWINSHRERLRKKYADVLLRLIHVCESTRDYPAAIRYTEALLVQDPLSEASYQMLMRLHALSGDRAKALLAYQRCATVLHKQLGVEPGITTQKLRERIVNIEPHPLAVLPSPGSADPAMVGREREWKQLAEIWNEVVQGGARLVILTGEAGIGKTRLLDELFTFASRQAASTARTACYAAERPMAYAALTEWLRAPPFRSKLERLSSAQQSQLARVLPELPASRSEPPLAFGEIWQRRHFFEALSQAIFSAPRPIALFIDDLQWCDPDTIEWLHYLVRSKSQESLLIAAGVRFEELDATHPATTMLDALVRSGRATQIALEPFKSEETGSLAELLSKGPVESEVAAALHEYTSGNPLFIVEAVRTGFLSLAASAPAESHVLPPRVQAVIAERLHQLTRPAYEIAGIASVIARPFTVEFLVKVSQADQPTVAKAVDELWRRRIFHSYQQHSYDFSHGQIRAVAYSELGPATRQLLHSRIAQTLESLHAGDSGAASAQIAWHYEQAGALEQAITRYHEAAKVVRLRYAEEEAIRYLTKALNLLEGLPGTPERDRLELGLLVTLGPSLLATRGYASPEVGRVYTRARLLCEMTGETGTSYFQTLSGSHAFHVVRAELPATLEVATRYAEAASRQNNPGILSAGYFALGSTLAYSGPLTQARDYLEAALAYYDSPSPPEPFYDAGPEISVFARSHLSHSLWLLGYADKALEQGRRCVAFAEGLAHPFSLALALAYLAMLHHFRQKPHAAEEHAVAAAEICNKYGFRYYLSWVPILQGWARAQTGALIDGLTQMQEGFAAFRSTGALLRAPYYLVLLAETCRKLGRLDEAWKCMVEAFAVDQQTGESWLKPELNRIKGDILLDRGDRRAAGVCYQEAFHLARNLGTKFFELRAAMRLVQLQTSSSQKPGAIKLLAESYQHFQEGLDTVDLLQARELLEFFNKNPTV